MAMFGEEFIIGGLVLVVLAQVAASIIAFRTSFTAGLCSLLVPGYLLVAMRRVGYYWKFVAFWVQVSWRSLSALWCFGSGSALLRPVIQAEAETLHPA